MDIEKTSVSNKIFLTIAILCTLIIICIYLINVGEKVSDASKLTIFDSLKYHLKNNFTFAGWSLFVIILYILLVTAIILIITASHDIKASKELGENFEKQCNGIFLEKERADFHIYSCYNALYDYDTKEGKFSNKRGAIRERFKTAYVYLLSMIIYIILAVLLVYTLVKCINFGMVSFLGGDNIELTMFWKPININKGDNKYQSYGLFMYVLALLLCQVLLFSSWVMGNSKEASLNPFSDITEKTDTAKYYENDSIQKVIQNHYTYITLILVVVILSLPGFNFKVFKRVPEVPTSISLMIIFILIALLIIVPLFMNSVKAFENNICSTYHDSITQLNDAVKKLYRENSALRKELEKNIMLDKRANMKSDDEIPPRVDLLNTKDYDEILYMYLPHILNNTHINGISIPQELKPLIENRFLAGELSVELKEQFIKTYYKHRDNTKITKENVGDLLPYFKESVRKDISSDAINLLNTHILNNDAFKKGNPLPDEILRKLETIRNNKTIKNTTETYTSTINGILMAILIVIMYHIYHNVIYPNDPDIKIQYVSMIVFIMVVILGIVGWVMKETWL